VRRDAAAVEIKVYEELTEPEIDALAILLPCQSLDTDFQPMAPNAFGVT
jgi:hypothetical protein